MVAIIAPYIVALFALTFAGVSALTLIQFVNGLDPHEGAEARLTPGKVAA